MEPRRILWLGCLIFVLIAEGMAVAHSYLWAAPLVGLLVVAVATDIPLIHFLALVLLVRVLTDATLSSTSIRHTGALNLSSGIALLFLLVGIGLLIRRRRGLWPVAAATLFLCFWTTIAISTQGASTETVREGVREASILALGVIVYNSRGVLSLSVVTRLIQLAGIASACLALYQLATHSGLLVSGQIRANGTFTQPDGAAMYFAIATTASLWQYLDNGRRRLDALLIVIYAAATISTFSITGLIALLAMLMTFGTLRPGSVRLKAGSYAVVGLILIAFLATPLGAERISEESATSLKSAETHGHANTSLAWRFAKWRQLLPEWERDPVFGQGLGTTVTAKGASEEAIASAVPHNEYLRYLVETGLIGLLILLWAITILIRRLAQKRRTPCTPGVLGIAIVVGCLFNALADNTLLYTTTGYAAVLIVVAVLSSPSSAVQPTSLMRTG
jgi:O-antigen ligase